ncbi:MAG: ABC transporter permease [Chloroflexi bacterium]|nr:ABC transporter permease [Chloroflexota bacterium]
MLDYTLRRLGGVLATLVLLSMFTFVLSRAIPGGPWDVGVEIPRTPEQIAMFKEKYGLDKPIWQQYLVWLRNAVTLDFGSPYMAPEMSVTQLILRQLPYSALVGGLAAALAITVGVILGMIAAARQNTWADIVINSAAVVVGTIPGFVLGFVLIYFFAAKLRWFPSGGWSDTGYKTLVLPVTAFGVPATGGVARWTRQCMVEAMSSDYVRTAYAKGVRQAGVMSRHVLRNALIPMITSFLPMFPAMMTGSVFIEHTFGIPGLGQWFVSSSFSRDYPMVLGITIFWAVLIALTYFVTDILYGVIDPRVRLTEKEG